MTEPRRRRRWPIVLGVLLLVVGIGVAVAVIALDRIVLSLVRRQTVALSQELSRPVVVEGVRTKILGGLGVRMTGLSIGPGPGEDRPLLELRRAEVEADLVQALRTRGEVVDVREVVLEGLRVNVVRHPDGTTNAERLARALEERERRTRPADAPSREPAPAEEPADLSHVRIDRAAVEDARIAFLDLSVAGAEELYVEDLDVEIRDLRAGRPLEVVVKAAVLADRQNLELRLQAAPLPPTLVPTPETLVVKAEPIALDPLAPFLPASVGLRGGTFQADLRVELGAAVPGGSGRTEIAGTLAARRLAFEGQEGGRALDVTLVADVDGDVQAGDLAIRALDLAVGPAGLTGRGRVTGLTGETPRVDGLEIVARGLDPAALAAWYPPLRRHLGDVVIAGPIGLSLRGSGSEAAQRIELRLDVGPVRLHVPDQLTKAAGAPSSLVARADVGQGGGRIRFDATLDLAGADLRPGGTLAKRPGDPLALSAQGTYARTASGQEIDLARADLTLLADRLTGSGKVILGGSSARPTTRFDLALAGDRLDLDRLLLETPEPGGGAEGGAPAAEEPLDPEAFAGVSGAATVRIGLLRAEKLDFRDVVARLRLDGDVLTVEQARLVAFGGTVSAAGTELRLASPDAPFKLVAELKGVQGAEVLGLLSSRKVLAGTLDLGIELGGKGTTFDPLARSLTGHVRGSLADGTFHGKDLVAAVAAPLARRLPFAAAKVTDGGATRLGSELPFAFRIADGLARLEEPLRFRTGGDAVALEGGVRLDGTLEMPATIALSPETIARITGGRARPQEAIPLAFRLAGPAWSPRLEGLSLDGAVQAIARQAASGAVGRALGTEGESVEDVAARKREEAEARAREEADRAKQRLEDEAKRRLRGLLER